MGDGQTRSTRLIIKNLPREVDEVALQKHINSIYGGNITDCRVIRKHGSKKSRMFAYVGFRTENAAEQALKTLDGTYYNTRRLEVAFAFSEGNSAIPRPWSTITKGKKGTEPTEGPTDSSSPAAKVAAAAEEFLEAVDAGGLRNRKKKRTIAELDTDDEGADDDAGLDWLKERSKAAKLTETAVVGNTQKSARLAADTGRIRILNIPYEVNEEDIRREWGKFGTIAEVLLPLTEEDSTLNRGYCFVTYMYPAHACAALEAMDGAIYQGRRLVVEGAEEHKAAARIAEEDKVMGDRKRMKVKSEVRKALEEDKLRRHKSAKSWNLLYTSGSAALEVISAQMGLNRDDILDASQASDSIAARAAVAETLVVRQVREWLEHQGFEAQAFEREGKNGVLGSDVPRCNDTMIAKHLSVNTDPDELREMFSRYGTLSRFTLAPTKTLGIISFSNPKNAKTAFKELLLKNYNSRPLLLEWAPESLFVSRPTAEKGASDDEKEKDVTAEETTEEDPSVTARTLFVANLAFTTTEDRLAEIFKECDGFRKATVAKKKKKTRNLKTGLEEEVWTSMGYGFVEFDTAASARAAQKKLASFVLDGHALRLSESKPVDDGSAAAKAKRLRKAKAAAEVEAEELKATKRLMVKNLPFEANVQDLKQLFETFGTIRSVRIPKKKDGSGRGYGFVDFASTADAANAMVELKHTHLLGRHLVLLPSKEEDQS